MRLACRRLIPALLIMLACSRFAVAAAPVEQWVEIARKPYDATNFTQGLEIEGGNLWVSSGLYGESRVRRYDWPELRLVAEQALPPRLFAEGVTRIDSSLLLLTWRARRLLIINAESLEIQGATELPGEGWGITHRDSTIWFTDGSDQLHRFDLDEAGSPITSVSVTLNGKPVRELNELEWVRNEIWANIWRTDLIARIDPETGVVNGVIDLRDLYPLSLRPRGADVLNGIAYDHDADTVWVTGKYWPFLFAIAPPSTAD